MMVERDAERRDYLNSFHYEGIDFDLRPMEWHLMQAILLGNESGGKIAQLFEKIPPSLIIDAGANVGMFSVCALSKWKDAKVFAVEPAPDTFSLLEKNQKRNPALSWHAFQFAFWKENGTITIESEASSMVAHVSVEAKGVEVPSIRLDHYIEKHLDVDERISLLKMDIEGAEEMTLKVAQKILQRVDAVAVEIQSSVCNKAVVRDILTREFKFVYDLSAFSTKHPVVLASREGVF